MNSVVDDGRDRVLSEDLVLREIITYAVSLHLPLMSIFFLHTE